MKILSRLGLLVAAAAFFIAGQASAETVTNHAFAVGKGPGVTGYTSLLCGSAQLAVGQAAADPICQTITGDVTISAAGVTAIGNIPNGTTAAGAILQSNIAAPATPVAGKEQIWTDTTDKRLHDKNDAGSIGTTVVSDPGAANNFLTAISSAGVIAKARPACASLSDASAFCNGTSAASLTGTQSTVSVPAFTGGDVTSLGGSLVLSIAANAVSNAKLATMLPYTIKGNATAASAAPTDISIPALTQKVSPVAADMVMIADSAASNALKYATVSSLASAGSVASVNGQTGAVTLLTAAQGRLTLTANTPVMSVSASGQTTLRYDCYTGNQVPYYTGTADALDTIGACEVTDVMVSAASAGQVVSGQVYDVWWVHSGAGRICLAMSSATGGGGGWASDVGGSNTARGTGYTQLDRITRPYITNKNAISNCFNAAINYGPVSANQGTYLGTVYASANGQISYTFGASASGGTAALFGVWNMYNRVLTTTTVTDSGASYAYASATIRQARASAGNQISFVLGLQEDGISFSYSGKFVTNAAANSTGAIGVGFDSATAFGIQFSQTQTPTAVSLSGATSNAGVWSAGVGFHTLAALEASLAADSVTFDYNSTNALMAIIRN